MKYDSTRHHRRSIRLKGYDYSQEGMYYVTVCVEQRACLLGEVHDGKVKLSRHGEIVQQEWELTAKLRSDVTLDAFVVMPNHFHGILFLRGGTSRRAPTLEAFGSSTKGSIPTIVRLFKSAVTKRVNEERRTPGAQFWQRGYYEHIIRDGEDLDRIREYILENPANWEGDQDFPGNIRMDQMHRGKRDWSGLD